MPPEVALAQVPEQTLGHRDNSFALRDVFRIRRQFRRSPFHSPSLLAKGTYHLPNAQLNHFIYELRIGYPSAAEEEAIVSSTTGVSKGVVRPVLTATEVLEMQMLVRRLPAPPSPVQYAVGIARATRPGEPEASAAAKKYVSLVPGPRAGQNLALGAKARAAMDGRAVPNLEDVDAVAFSVLTRRVLLNSQTEPVGMGI